MQKRIARNLVQISILSILLSLVLGTAIFYNTNTLLAKSRLREEADFLASMLLQVENGADFLQRADPAYGGRITYIDADGTVLYDSFFDAELLPNYKERDEVQDAFQTGEGEITRRFDQTGENMLRYAKRMKNGQVVRVSLGVSSIWTNFASAIPYIISLAMALMLLSLIVARNITRRIVKPINMLDLSDPLHSNIYEEMMPLVLRLHDQNAQIRKQMHELNAQRDRFNAITNKMQEGLLVFDEQRQMLSINNSAQELLGVREEDVLGRDVNEWSDSQVLKNMVERACAGNYGDALFPIRDREYLIRCNPVLEENGAVTGVVLLLFDITQQRTVERMRREFSANVSHELKTPLTSISGYAEIMMSGIAKPDVMPDFAKRIFEESTRMKTMVENILLLSLLDEGGEALPYEVVDLAAAAECTAARYEKAAQAQRVSISMELMPVEIRAIRSVLEEIIGNLVENAIRYNKSGGSVRVGVQKEGDLAVLTVSDTGMGIAKEHQSRVFERFYRIDASHAKTSGGSGLGLAIVRRGARLHDARIELKSEPGEGTTMRIFFMTA